MRAQRLAWSGNFSDAHRILHAHRRKMHHDFDRLLYACQCALFLSLDREIESSLALVQEVPKLLASVNSDGLFARRQVSSALMYAAIAASLNARAVQAERLVRQIERNDAVCALLSEVSSRMLTD
jgi:hypothetical protein